MEQHYIALMAAAPKENTEFWLTGTEAEPDFTQVLGGSITIGDEVLPAKVVMNKTDVRAPRLLVRCPRKDFVGKQMFDLPLAYLLFFQAVLIPALCKAAEHAFKAKLTNCRSEGNVALRPGSKEPITPHWHLVPRDVANPHYSDPKPGEDYGLATDKVALEAQTRVTAADMRKYSHELSQYLRENLEARIEELRGTCGLNIEVNLTYY